jgi:hypothetical protein
VGPTCTRGYVSTAKQNVRRRGEMGGCTHGSHRVCVYKYHEGGSPDADDRSECHSTLQCLRPFF